MRAPFSRPQLPTPPETRPAPPCTAAPAPSAPFISDPQFSPGSLRLRLRQVPAPRVPHVVVQLPVLRVLALRETHLDVEPQPLVEAARLEPMQDPLQLCRCEALRVHRRAGAKDGISWTVLVSKTDKTYNTTTYTNTETVNINEFYSHFALTVNKTKGTNTRALHLNEWYIYGQQFVQPLYPAVLTIYDSHLESLQSLSFILHTPLVRARSAGASLFVQRASEYKRLNAHAESLRLSEKRLRRPVRRLGPLRLTPHLRCRRGGRAACARQRRDRPRHGTAQVRQERHLARHAFAVSPRTAATRSHTPPSRTARARAPRWHALCVCVCLLLQDLVQICLRGEGGILEDMCYERRRAEAFVD